MVSIICYTNNTITLEHSYFTSSQLLRQDISSTTIFQSTHDILSGSFYLVCTQLECNKPFDFLDFKINFISFDLFGILDSIPKIKYVESKDKIPSYKTQSFPWISSPTYA